MSDQLKDLHFLATRLQSMAADGHGYFAQNDIARMIRTADAMFAADAELTRLRAALADAKAARDIEHAKFLDVGSMYITAKCEVADERKRALDEAAKVAEEHAEKHRHNQNRDEFSFGHTAASEDVAAAIRALMEKP